MSATLSAALGGLALPATTQVLPATGPANAGATAQSAGAGKDEGDDDRAAIGNSVAQHGNLAPAQRRLWQLRAASGDYVRGRLEGKRLQLSLIDADGQRERVLIDGSRSDGDRDFMFVVGPRAPYLMEVTSPPAASAYRLVLDAVLAKADQRAPAAPVLESPLLRAYAGAMRPAGNGDTFHTEVMARGTPLVETADVVPPLAEGMVLVTFLWRGARNNVRLFGAPSGDHDALQRLDDSDIWFRSYRVPRTTRLGYRLAPDVPELDATPAERRRAILATAQRDPGNAVSFPAQPVDRYAGESVLTLPDAPSQQWTLPAPATPRGTLTTFRIASKILGNSREVTLYRPPGYRPRANGNALLVLFDADAYLSLVPTPTILDNLIAAGRLPSTAAILIGNADAHSRGAELPPNPAFAAFLADELMPWARRQGVHAAAGRTVIAGSSYGGLAAAYAGLKHPALFGNVYSQSGSFWWSPPAKHGGDADADSSPEWLAREYARLPRRRLRFYLEAGLFEAGKQQQTGILESTRHLRDVLRARGYPVQHVEYASGHDYLHWRGTLATGLTALLGAAHRQAD